MSARTPRALVVLMVVALLGVPGMPGDVVGDDRVDGRGPAPLSEDPVWSDSLDDLSHVYVPMGGLVGVEVSGGAVRLAPGATEGWVASSVIACPPDLRYDTVHLLADTPGASYVRLTMLDATKDPSEVGYANETVPGFVKLDASDLSVYEISPSQYPRIRIQVNLYASGVDRPTLDGWSLRFIGLEVWRDEFIWPGKMSEHRGWNFTSGGLEVNLTSKTGGGVGDYEEFPTVVCSGEYNGVEVFYANAQKDGYNDFSKVNIGGWSNGLTYDDLNNDGYFDILALMWVGRLRILWGSALGTWSATGATTLDHPVSPASVATGDFNGDGDRDIIVGCNSGSGDFSYVYLNKGGGTFVDNADITLPMDGSSVSTGDLDSDGRDDILLSHGDAARVYLGGDAGPDTTADISFTTANCLDTLIEDVDGDGHLDVMLADRYNGKTQVFLGDRDGPDATPDYELGLSDMARACEAGDVNGDGYTDLIYYVGSGTSYKVSICEGGSQGWSDARVHSDITHDNSGDTLWCVDLDKDGYEDLLQIQSIGGSEYRLKMWFGGTSWPSTPDIVKPCGYAYSVVALVPRGAGGTRTFRGSFTTEPISMSPQTQKWDILLLEGEMPANTSVSISVLDGAGDEITGFTDLTDWDVDLSTLGAQSPIMVQVTAASEFNWTTPVLERLSVMWMAKGYWRERFYGMAKVERVMYAGVGDGMLRGWGGAGIPREMLFASLRGDTGYDVRPTYFMGDVSFYDPITFNTRGASALDLADVNGDGISDVVFAVHQLDDSTYSAKSPLFLNSPIGWRDEPDWEFPTVGASDVLLEDLNRDGHVDVVFAQERDGTGYLVNSTLFWGNPNGFNATADVQFATTGASGVAAVDLDGDGRTDLAFSCYRDATSTSTDSMTFVQGPGGFDGSSPTHRLPTKGARAVAAGDLDRDGRPDLVFANNFDAGSTEIASYIYRSMASGGFETTPTGLRTSGAEDVLVTDLDDEYPDVIFANSMDNAGSYDVDSYVYMGPFDGTSRTLPDIALPTVGASAVSEMPSLNGPDYMPGLVFAGSYNGTSHSVASRVFDEDFQHTGFIMTEVATEGVSDVHGMYGNSSFVPRYSSYLSRPITPEDPSDTGSFHTLRCTASRKGATFGLVDARTLEVLAEAKIDEGQNELVVDGAFRIKEHPSVRVMVYGIWTLDDITLNWTQRVKLPPTLGGVEAMPQSLLRMTAGILTVNVTDGYDTPGELQLSVGHRLQGETVWGTGLFGAPMFANGTWIVPLFARADAAVGPYDVQLNVRDTDGLWSGPTVYEGVLEVLNNVPTAPVVRIMPAAPLTTTSLRAEVVTPAMDVETGVVYRFAWYRDGTLVNALTEDTVPSAFTTRGENWSVEVRAFDGLDLGPPALAWVVIQNAPPLVSVPLPDPELPEDTVDDRWLDLGLSFSDPDGDALTFSLAAMPEHIGITIDPLTGRVTLRPDLDWFGQEPVTFVASDGLLTQSQTVLITVTPVNDAPRFTTLNGVPIATDPVPFEVAQGGVLTIVVGAQDVEGDRLVFSVNTTAVEVDPDTGEMRFSPGNDVVGTVRYAITMYDEASPNVKVRLNITIKVTNVNDPPGDARITNPRAGDKFKVNQTFSLIGTCTDPDTPFGQVLNYTWWWNGTHLFGYGSSLTVSFDRPGNYTITVNVTDGEYFREAHVAIVIEGREVGPPPPPPPPRDDEGLGAYLWIIALVVLVVVGGVIFLVMGRRRAVEEEEAEEVDEKREALQRMAVAARETAEQMERELGEARASKPAGARPAELEEIKVEGLGSPAERRGLSVEMKVTEQASKEVQALFKGVGGGEVAPPTEDQEALRLEGLKRKFQTAIARLPYGIPSPEIKDREWTWLAGALATGEKKTLPDGHEVTQVEGRWYYSDVKDASSFLKEHGAKGKAEPRRAAAPAVDRAVLLARLEERFILGEVSEEAYKALKRKYTPPKTEDEWVEEG